MYHEVHMCKTSKVATVVNVLRIANRWAFVAETNCSCDKAFSYLRKLSENSIRAELFCLLTEQVIVCNSSSLEWCLYNH